MCVCETCGWSVQHVHCKRYSGCDRCFYTFRKVSDQKEQMLSGSLGSPHTESPYKAWRPPALVPFRSRGLGTSNERSRHKLFIGTKKCWKVLPAGSRRGRRQPSTSKGNFLLIWTVGGGRHRPVTDRSPRDYNLKERAATPNTFTAHVTEAKAETRAGGQEDLNVPKTKNKRPPRQRGSLCRNESHTDTHQVCVCVGNITLTLSPRRVCYFNAHVCVFLYKLSTKILILLPFLRGEVKDVCVCLCVCIQGHAEITRAHLPVDIISIYHQAFN